MSDDSAPPPIPRRPAKKKKPVLLLVLVPLLAIAIVLLVVDRQARSAAEEANRSLEKAQSEGTLTPADVRKLLDREPAEETKAGSGHLTEKYTWRGGLKSYYVYTVYSPGNDPLLITVTLNDAPPTFK